MLKKVISTGLAVVMLAGMIGLQPALAAEPGDAPKVETLGAQLREPIHTDTPDSFDLRFVSSIPAEDFDANASRITEMGTLLVKKNDLREGDVLDLDLYESGEITVKKVPATYLNTSTEGEYRFTCAIWKISKTKYDTDYTARGYVMYQDAETGEPSVQYADEVTRSIRQMGEASGTYVPPSLDPETIYSYGQTDPAFSDGTDVSYTAVEKESANKLDVSSEPREGIFIVNSVSQLEALNAQDDFYVGQDAQEDAPNGWYHQSYTDGYDDEFFKDNALVVVWLVKRNSGNSFVYHSLTKKDGALYLDMTTEQGDQGDDTLTSWRALLTVKKADVADVTEVGYRNVQN